MAQPTPTEILKRKTEPAHTRDDRAKAERNRKRRRLITSRFSEGFHKDESTRRAHSKFGKSKYLLADIERALAMRDRFSMYAIAKITGIHYWLLRTVAKRNTPLPAHIYKGEKDVRRIVRLAIEQERKTGEIPLRCLWHQWRKAGLNTNSLQVYLSMERIPFPLTFEIYYDKKAQMRCAAMWNAQDGSPVVMPAEIAIRPAARNCTPPSAAQTPAPARPPERSAQATSLLTRRRTIGYGFQLEKTIPRR